MRKSSLFIAIFLIIALFIITILIYLRASRPQATTQTSVRAQNTSDTRSIEQEVNKKLESIVAENMSHLSPYQQLKFNEFKQLLPMATESANIRYSAHLNRIIISLPQIGDTSGIMNLLEKNNVLDIYQLEETNAIVIRQADSPQQAENEEVKLVLTQIKQKTSSQKDVEGVSTVNAQTPQNTQADPDEPYQSDQGEIVHMVEFFQDLMSFGEPDKELDASAEGNFDDSSHDDTGEQDENGPLVLSPDTSGIPCEAGKDLGTKDGYRRGIKVIIKVCEVQGVQVNSQISGEMDRLFTAARSAGLEMAKGSSGFRTMTRQKELRRINGCPADDNAPSSTCKTPTARPGWSNHQMGLAIDFVCEGSLIRSKTGSCFSWLASNAAKYGLQNFPKEAWHWSVDGR